MMADLSIDIGSIRLKNPVLAASGTFGYGREFKPFMDLNELGGFVVKGLYYSAREGNPPPRLVETASGLINAIGLQGIGVERFCAEILPELRTYRTALIINVCGENEEEYAAVVEFLNAHEGIAAYELNISCPNVEKEGLCPAINPDSTYSVVKRVKSVSARPLITKLSSNVSDIGEISVSAQEAGSDAVSLVNTFLAMAVDLQTKRPKLANVLGGLSGPAIKPIALRMVFQVASRIHIPIIGIGGIMSGADALEYMLCGARAVEVGTANFIDPESCIRIVRELEEYCRTNGIPRIQDIIGSLDLKGET